MEDIQIGQINVHIRSTHNKNTNFDDFLQLLSFILAMFMAQYQSKIRIYAHAKIETCIC